MSCLAWAACAAGGYLLAALLYYHGRFRPALAAGAGFWVTGSLAALEGLGPAGGAVAVFFLAVLPAALLAVHVYDARHGAFLVPTIYAIPLAFATGLLFWIAALLGCLL